MLDGIAPNIPIFLVSADGKTNPLDYFNFSNLPYLPRIGEELELPDGFYKVTRVQHCLKSLPFHINIYVIPCDDDGLEPLLAG